MLMEDDIHTSITFNDIAIISLSKTYYNYFHFAFSRILVWSLLTGECLVELLGHQVSRGSALLNCLVTRGVPC